MSDPTTPTAARRPAEPLTVAAALRDTPLREADVLAGIAGLDRTIETVGVFDPDELDALRPGHLVLSTALPLKQLDLDQLVQRLVHAKVSGLGVKLRGVWPALPDALVAACDAHELPLLTLPAGRFEDLVNPVLQEIAGRQSERLRRMAALHDALTRAALGDEPMASIAATVAAVLDVAVAVFDADGVPVTAIGDAATWAHDELTARAAGVEEAERIVVAGVPYLLAPISTTGRRYGAICAAGAIADEAFARVTLAQAAVVCGMQLVGQLRVERVHRRFERELLEELADPDLAPEEARARAQRLGWRRRAPYVVLLAARRRPSVGEQAATPALDERFASEVARALGRWERDMRTFPRREGLVVVAHLAEGETPAALADAVHRRVLGAWDGAPASGTPALGVSRPRQDAVHLSAALREARLALVTARLDAPAVTRFDDLGALRLMAHAEPDTDLVAVARQALGPLGDPDLPGRDDLVATLDALLHRNMRLRTVAEDLHFHYSTVRHRITRLRKLLGDRVDAPDQRAALALALAALRVAEADRAATPAQKVIDGRGASRRRRRSAPARTPSDR